MKKTRHSDDAAEDRFTPFFGADEYAVGSRSWVTQLNAELITS